MRYIFLLFIIIPIIEITLLINVGQMIGIFYTIGLVLLSAFIGVNMLRIQSLSTLMKAQERMNQGEIPGKEMAEGVVLAVGGALLVTPGFVTDVIGFCCLIPWSRAVIVRFLSQRFHVIASRQSVHTSYTETSSRPSHTSQGASGDVIDGEYTRKE
ncbi:biotin--acetyl-CoA-carboxylase ligase [Nitrincola tibetensis]|uniref:Biotin--acetyl-CoA-carboxylase ligase n=1 Tax=Nitrincola tibetensis TaxID=2219697 RepID=A0A364NRG7_9GAMM|nr:FxsA family protein [Nitrincola tibetensis]RAU19709.1 biotin--acetyl-CoA-carboxylase ligase [Nitrincola tibetensis]